MTGEPAHADLILRNCRLPPAASAQLESADIGIWRGQILAVAQRGQIDHLSAAKTAEVDLGGRFVMPGLTDAHLHLAAYARFLDQVDCGTDTIAACLERISTAADKLAPHEWIEGHGWDQHRWGGVPGIGQLDRASRGRPLYLTGKSLHVALANSSALREADVDERTPDPTGGRIGRTADGAPNGLLYEQATQLVSRAIPHPTTAQLANMLARAIPRLWRSGITGVHDFDGRDCFLAIQDLRASNRLGLRIVKNLRAEYLEDAQNLGLRSGLGDAWIRIGAVKVFADGALGARTAAMLEPYDHDTRNRGILLMDEEEILEVAIRAGEAGFGMTIHAIGDAANHAALNALAELRRQEATRSWPPRRHRLEHLQVMHPDDLPRPAALRVIASMQPMHAISDRPAAERYWGERTQYAYAWRTQLEAGAVLAFGSDAPVEDPNPFLGLSAAASRLDPSAPELGPWHPEQSIPLAAALGAYTTGPAFAAGLEKTLGRIEAGYLADLIVLDDNLFDIEPLQIAHVRPVGVLLDGEWVIRTF